MAGSHHSEEMLFPLFMFSVLLLILIPTTLIALCGSSAGGEGVTNLTVFNKRKSKAKKGGLFSTYNIALMVGWALAAMMLMYVSTTTSEQDLFEPFDILGLEEDATSAQIKKAYRGLSMQYHPDKNPDPEGQKFFVEKIQKAYKALTDETARANLKRYGHPDGPQGYSVGVALPSWLLERTDKSGQIAILVIILLFGIIGPGVAAIVYLNRSNKFTTAGVNRDTIQNFAHYMRGKDALSVTKVLPVLITAAEFAELKYGGADKAAALQDLARNLRSVIEKEEKIKDAGSMQKFLGRHPKAVKAHLLFLAYLSGTEVADCLVEDMEYMVKTAPMLLDEMLKFSLLPRQGVGCGVLRPALSCLEACQSVVRSVPIGSRRLDGAKGADFSPLLQLPHVSEDIAKKLGKKGVRSLQDLLKLEVPESTATLEACGVPSEGIDDIQLALDECPNVVVDARFATPGHDNIQANDLSTLYVRLAIKRRARSNKGSNQDSPYALRGARFPAPKAEAWHVMLADEKRGLVIMNNRAVVSVAEEVDGTVVPEGEIDVNAKTTPEINAIADATETGEAHYVPKGGHQIAMLMRMPPPGRYSWSLHVVCDSWIGLDSSIPITVEVAKPEEVKAKPVKALKAAKKAKAAASGSTEIEEIEEESSDDDDSDAPVDVDADGCIDSDEYEDDEVGDEYDDASDED